MQNNENYSGFDLTMYNLFTLLREMYYTRGETETNFLQKSGGVLSGSLTIQGNLVINGQSYTIDTENLKVGDYTITLAKDNEQTLTSMVGMVVPKYDGTNYGFFGWDADGYAYVGDLTNYDGTSAITLANNSSLQRISTIDTTNTVVASNGVIYVYDATSHCFKKPTNDNKYYVIRNGAFVETELFTEQKSKNISNALYNVGTFDIISGNTITRQTGILILDGSENWTLYGTNDFYLNLPNAQASGGVVSNSTIQCDIDNSKNINFYPTNITTLNDWKQYLLQNNIYIQYQLASPYPENIIPNQPLLNLDSNGCNWLQNEWEKGLNLSSMKVGYDFNFTNGSISYTGNTDRAISDFIEYNGQDIIASNMNNSNIWSVFACYDTNKGYLGRSGGGYASTKRLSQEIIIPSGTKYVVFFYYSNNLTNVDTNVMLNYGTHTYPYEPPYGAIVREKDIEPVLLWENSSPTSSFAEQDITVKDMSNFKYLVIAYKDYYEFGVQYLKVLNENKRFYLFSISAGSSGTKTKSRTIVVNSSTSITFGDAYEGTTLYNGDCVPVAIYGTNVL